MAEIVQSRNSFLVTVRLDEDAEPLRPVSEGIAHIDVGRTTWLASLLKQPIHYIRKNYGSDHDHRKATQQPGIGIFKRAKYRSFPKAFRPHAAMYEPGSDRQ